MKIDNCPLQEGTQFECSDLNYKEKTAGESNKGKKVKFFDGMGNEKEGWIYGLCRFGLNGELCWVISQSKKPRTKVSLLAGRWFLIHPLYIIH